MTSVIERSWSDLPADILNGIAECLLYVDQIRFRVVCKSWRSNNNPTRPALDQLPWVMAIDDNDDGLEQWFNRRISLSPNISSLFCKRCSSSLFYLYDPSQKQKYTMQNNILIGAKVHASKHGWLLLSSKVHPLKPSSVFTLYTPFTQKIIPLPELHMKDGYNEATFSAPPTSQDCKIFILTVCSKQFCVSTCSPRDETWRYFWFDGNHGEVESLAFVGGVFYCLFSNKVMGSFQAEEEWRIHPYPSLRRSTEYDTYILIESHDENLLATCHTLHNLPQVWRYDEIKMKWLEVETLGDNRMLFLGVTSMLLPAVEEASGLANTRHLALAGRTWSHFLCNNRYFGIHSSYFRDAHTTRLPTYDWIGEEELKKIWIQPLKQT